MLHDCLILWFVFDEVECKFCRSVGQLGNFIDDLSVDFPELNSIQRHESDSFSQYFCLEKITCESFISADYVSDFTARHLLERWAILLRFLDCEESCKPSKDFVSVEGRIGRLILESNEWGQIVDVLVLTDLIHFLLHLIDLFMLNGDCLLDFVIALLLKLLVQLVDLGLHLFDLRTVILCIFLLGGKLLCLLLDFSLGASDLVIDRLDLSSDSLDVKLL